MNSNPRESQALNNQRPSVHSYGYNPVPTLQERIHSVFSTPLPHNPCSYQDSLFTDLLEVRITLPSVSYLRANQGRHFGSVPPEILRTYTHRAITETDHHHAAVAFPPDIHPRESAWWMVGDVLRVVGDSLDSEVTSWWESASMSARGSRSSQASSTGRSAPYSICSSDRFSLSFRTLNDGDGVVEEATTRHSTLDRLGRGPGQGSSNGASSLASWDGDWQSMLPDDRTCANGSNAEQAAVYEEEIQNLRSETTDLRSEIRQLYGRLQQSEALIAQQQQEQEQQLQHINSGKTQIKPGETAQARFGQFRASRNSKDRGGGDDDDTSITTSTGAEQHQQRRRRHQDEAAVSEAKAKRQQRWILRQQEHEATVSRLEATIIDGNEAMTERNREIRQLRAQLRQATERNDELQTTVDDQAGEIDSMIKEAYGADGVRARLTKADSTIVQLEGDKTQLRQIIRRLEYDALPIEELRSKCKARGITMPLGDPDKKEFVNMLVMKNELDRRRETPHGERGVD